MMTVLERIVSGGQTGADRAALDGAIEAGIEHGGWCPKGRTAENGVIPDQYDLAETSLDDYAQRTEWNVRDSDATVLISLNGKLSGGTQLTAQFAGEFRKPLIHIKSTGARAAAAVLRKFVHEHEVRVLNVAGPRESEQPGIYDFVRSILRRFLADPE